MWIYEYQKFDGSGYLPFGPYHSPEEAADAMNLHAARFGERVQGPKRIDENWAGTFEQLRLPVFQHS